MKNIAIKVKYRGETGVVTITATDEDGAEWNEKIDLSPCANAMGPAVWGITQLVEVLNKMDAA